MKCPECGGATSCLAGESAHPSNWYCDDETCGWNAWTTPQQKIITIEMQLTEAVDEIAKLKEKLEAVYDAGMWGIEHVAMANYAYRELEAKQKLREAANDQNQRTDVGSLQRWLNDEATK